MKELLYWGVGIVARIHNEIMQLNNAFEMNFNDKQLHFLIIGILGMAMVLFIHPLFRYMARRGWELAISFIYVFTVIIVITFAIEIGQKISGTGQMEFADIAYGIVGFLLMFVVYALLRGIVLLVVKLIRSIRNHAGD